MVANIAFNPYLQNNATGSFGVSADGLMQGTAMDDPAVRYRMKGGYLADTETIPMWGGVGVYADVPYSSAGNPNQALGGKIGRATTLTVAQTKTLLGFSVFDQNYAAVNTPQSPVPLIASKGLVNWYPLGSFARIAVKCDPSLISLEGGILDANVSWDFVNQLLVPYIGTLTISSGTYNNTTGVVVLTMSAPVGFDAGDAIVVSGLTGTGAFASLDGTFTSTFASGSTVKYNAGAGLGAATITGGSLTLGSGASVALPAKVLRVDVGNSMVVDYDPVTGFATWDREGSAALIQLYA